MICPRPPAHLLILFAERKEADASSPMVNPWRFLSSKCKQKTERR
jgi:hypothetical protein